MRAEPGCMPERVLIADFLFSGELRLLPMHSHYISMSRFGSLSRRSSRNQHTPMIQHAGARVERARRGALPERFAASLLRERLMADIDSER